MPCTPKSPEENVNEGDTEARWDDLVPAYQALAANVSQSEGALDDQQHTS